jgi:putative DNA-invertase from lambdoid prophage Rac
MTIYGYLRVSTERQFIENYKNAILTYANEHKMGSIEWIQETVSGRKFWEKRLLGQFFKERMKKGDIILTAEFSRIGRDMLNSLSFIAEAKQKGVKVISINGDIPDDDSATSTLILSMTAWKNQMEREMIATRTKIGIQCARARGKQIGRPKDVCKLDKDLNNIRTIKEELEKGVKMKSICVHYKCTMPTLRKFIKKHELKPKEMILENREE